MVGIAGFGFATGADAAVRSAGFAADSAADLAATAGCAGAGDWVFVSTFLPAAASLAIAKCRARDCWSAVRRVAACSAALLRFASRFASTSPAAWPASACRIFSTSAASTVLIALETSTPDFSAAFSTSALEIPASFAIS